MSLPAPWQVPDAGAGDSGRKKQKTDDPEAVVILHGVGAAKFVEPVKTKEILTPRARDLRSLENGFPSSEKDMFAMEGRECNASTSSEEDTDSEGYMQRHAPLEAEERTRYTSDGGRNKPRCSGAVGIEDRAKGKKTPSSGREHRNRMPKMQSLNSFDEKSTGTSRPS